MNPFASVLFAVSLLCAAPVVLAETYKCVKNGQKVFSDAPCAAEAARVDQQADQTNREQRRQAEAVHRGNKTQLSELEQEAMRDRYAPRRAYVLRR